MKRRVRLLLLCVSVLLLWSCEKSEALPSSKQEIPVAVSASSTVTGDDNMNETAMTDQEIELLSQLYQDENRIRQGKLFSHQKEALLQLRAEMEYLAQKYPDGTYTIIKFQSAIKFNSGAELTIEDGGEYTVYAEVDGENYVCSDNYYGKYLQPRYDQHIEEVLSNGGYPGRSYSSFPAGSDKLGPDTTVEQLLKVAPKQLRMVDLFVTAQNHDEAVRDLQALMTQAGLYGTYMVYFVPELADIQTLENQRAGLEYAVFSCFDI